MGVRNATNLNGMIGRSFDHIFDASELTFTLFILVYFSRFNLIISELCTASMAIGGGFFDQYSVFCVFGSVVGCVVVPLITQVKLMCRHTLLSRNNSTIWCFILMSNP